MTGRGGRGDGGRLGKARHDLSGRSDCWLG